MHGINDDLWEKLVDRQQVKKEKRRLDKIVGKNVRHERELRKLSRDELAELLDLTPSHVGLIERGDRGATAVTLRNLGRIFGATMDRFFMEEDPDEATSSVRERNKSGLEAGREKVISLMTYLNERELEFLAQQVKGIIAMNYSLPMKDGELE